ncbi:signal peptidase I [Bacillus sp. FJAT-45037]|uniref:signal peptidase I n=1 Tax=Bacillus sp. FJAT-45037 TaxID=2011007 RepID=UPI000C2448BC|nr:signal peptidase I [Bacillus sp. FJAT-45037]
MNAFRSHWVDWLKAIIVALLFATIIRAFFFISYEVRGESMMPSAYDGERFIINKVGYNFVEPDRFDLIVFHATETEDYIKRVIALPGDTVQYVDDRLYINGEYVDEPFLVERVEEGNRMPYTYDFAYPQVIPEGHVFVLGDNRPYSKDSRMIGPISYESIVGKVDMRFWPITAAGWMNDAKE